ncbi:MAG: conjugative transposon TraM protein [Sphingobacteriales bacterium]|nr:conjugative transposon TraM protein [Sphingobacteriales bacterium]
MEKQLSAETLRKRKFLMVLPLLMLPFITVAFWALGGGKGKNITISTMNHRGFNTDLPQAKFITEEKDDKFSVYEASARELQKTNKENKQPFRDLDFPSQKSDEDENAEKIDSRISEIHAVLQKQNTSSPIATESNEKSKPANSKSTMTADVNRLEAMMKSMQQGNSEDPEMAQLNSVLEKILEIQNPQRNSKPNKGSINNSKNAFAVQVVDTSSNLQGVYAMTSGGKLFNTKKSIHATIHQNQEIVSGSVIKLRLLDSISLNRVVIPKNEFVYGIAKLDGERLKISIETLRIGDLILPVSLTAFDLDGLEGLYVPGSITREATKNGAEDAIQSLQIMSMDPSITAQVAGAGVQAAKGLFGKKVKQVRVKVKAGYDLLLRDMNHY